MLRPGKLLQNNPEGRWRHYRLMYEEQLFTEKAEMNADIATLTKTDYREFFDVVFGMDERLEFSVDREETAGEQEQKTNARDQTGQGSRWQAGRKP